MAEIKFELKTDLAPIQGTVLEANFEECKAALQERMEPYATLVVTEDGIKSAKGDLAEIRKIRGNIDDARKTVKKIYSAPLAEFEGKCKELTGLCDAAIDNLDGQVKAFQAQQQQEKIEHIRAYFNSRVGEMVTFLRWEDVYNERWKNATYKIETATEEIDAALEKCRQDVGSLLSLHSPYEGALFDHYRQTHDLGACLQKAQELQEMEERAQQERKAREAAKQRAATPAAPQAARRVAKSYQPASEGTSPPPAEPKVYVIDFRVYITENYLDELKQFFQERGIRYEKVPDRA